MIILLKSMLVVEKQQKKILTGIQQFAFYLELLDCLLLLYIIVVLYLKKNKEMK